MSQRAGPQYDASSENQFRDGVRRDLDERIKRGDHIFSDRNKFVLRSPDGTRWALKVSDDGTVSAEAFG